MKFLIDNSAVVIFFIAYKFFNNDIKIATIAMMIVSTSMSTVSWIITRKISVLSCIQTGLLCVTGMLSVITGDARFVKMKPTIVYTLFAVILLSGYVRKQGYIKEVFYNSVALSDSNWLKLSLRCGLFFLLLAILNEIVWRNWSEDMWVNFKLLGILPISFLFILSQVPFVLKNKLNTDM